MHCVDFGYKLTGIPEFPKDIPLHHENAPWVSRLEIENNGSTHVMFWSQFAGDEIPWHIDGKGRPSGEKDIPMTASFNYILDVYDDRSPVVFRDTEYWYSSALIDVASEHMVPRTPSDRKMFRIACYNTPFNQIVKELDKVFERGSTISHYDLVDELTRICDDMAS